MSSNEEKNELVVTNGRKETSVNGLSQWSVIFFSEPLFFRLVMRHLGIIECFK